MKRTCVRFVVLLAPLALLAQERVDLSVVNRIKQEAFENSKVMENAFYLSDVYGSRMAGSPDYRRAAEWVVKKLKEMGLEDAKLEKWGKFGRSWSYNRIAVNMLEPVRTSLIAVPMAWSSPTKGPVAGEVVMVNAQTPEDVAKFKGKVKGKWIITQEPRNLAPPFEPHARRYTDAQLAAMAQAPDPSQGRSGRRADPSAQYRVLREVMQKIGELARAEGALGILSQGQRGDGGTVFHSSAGSRTDREYPPVSIVLGSEDYNRIARLVDAKIPVKIEVDLDAQFYENQDGYNVVANLYGGSKKDEVVIIGGHLDSWHAGTGATDNAIGCAVMMEVMRILKALNLKMDRSVRIALWDAEEQGLIGSREYVTAHFADRTKMELKKDHAKVSGYFNIDNGAGKIRGVYMQGNDMMRPIFEAWFEPFKDLGVTTITNRNTTGTDHLSFDAVGIPAFQFIQDPLDYSARTHHTNMDVYDRLQPGDAMQMSAVVASIVYHAATRPELLPRKPLPKPSPEAKPAAAPKATAAAR